MWRRAIEQIPEQLDGLIGEVLDMKRTNKLERSVGAWLNRNTYNALLERDKKERSRR
jgi:hypothetical protein